MEFKLFLEDGDLFSLMLEMKFSALGRPWEHISTGNAPHPAWGICVGESRKGMHVQSGSKLLINAAEQWESAQEEAMLADKHVTYSPAQGVHLRDYPRGDCVIHLIHSPSSLFHNPGFCFLMP